MSDEAISVIRAISDIDTTVNKLSGSITDLQKFIEKVEIKAKEFVNQLQGEEIKIYISMAKYRNIILQMQLTLAENEQILQANINNSTKLIQRHYRNRKRGGVETVLDIEINKKSASKCPHSADDSSTLNNNLTKEDSIKKMFSEMRQDLLPYKRTLADLNSKFKILRRTTDPECKFATELFGSTKEIETQTEPCPCCEDKVTRSTSATELFGSNKEIETQTDLCACCKVKVTKSTSTTELFGSNKEMETQTESCVWCEDKVTRSTSTTELFGSNKEIEIQTESCACCKDKVTRSTCTTELFGSNKEIETQTESCSCSTDTITRSTSPQKFRSIPCSSNDSLKMSKNDENIKNKSGISKHDKENENQIEKEISKDRNQHTITKHDKLSVSNIEIDDTQDKEATPKQTLNEHIFTSNISISESTDKYSTKYSSTKNPNIDPNKCKDIQKNSSKSKDKKQPTHINKLQDTIDDKRDGTKSPKLKDTHEEIKHKKESNNSSTSEYIKNHTKNNKSQSGLTKIENKKSFDLSTQKELNKPKGHNQSNNLQTSKTCESRKPTNIGNKKNSDKSTQKEPNSDYKQSDHLQTSKLCENHKLNNIESKKNPDKSTQKHHNKPKDYKQSNNLKASKTDENHEITNIANLKTSEKSTQRDSNKPKNHKYSNHLQTCNPCEACKRDDHPKESPNLTNTQKEDLSQKVHLQEGDEPNHYKNSNHQNEKFESTPIALECNNQNKNKGPNLTGGEKENSCHKTEHKQCYESKNSKQSDNLVLPETVDSFENSCKVSSHFTNTQKIYTSQKDVYTEPSILDKNKDRDNPNTSKTPNSLKDRKHSRSLNLIYEIPHKKSKKQDDTEVYTQLEASQAFEQQENNSRGLSKLNAQKNDAPFKEIGTVSDKSISKDQIQRSQKHIPNKLSNFTEMETAATPSMKSQIESVKTMGNIISHVNKLEHSKQQHHNSLGETSRMTDYQNAVTALKIDQVETTNPNYNKHSSNLYVGNSLESNIDDYEHEFIKEEHDFETILNSDYSNIDSDSTLILEEKYVPSLSHLESVDIQQDLPSQEMIIQECRSLEAPHASRDGNSTDITKLLKTYSDPNLSIKVPVVVLENNKFADVKHMPTDIERNATNIVYDEISNNKNNDEKTVKNPVVKGKQEYLLRCKERLAKDYNINVSGPTPRKQSATKNTSKHKKIVNNSHENVRKKRKRRSRSSRTRNKRRKFDTINSTTSSLITYVPVINLDAVSTQYQMLCNNTAISQPLVLNSIGQTNLASYLPPQNLMQPPNTNCKLTVGDITESTNTVNKQSPVNPIYKFNNQDEVKKKSNTTTAFKYHAVNEKLLYLPPEVRENKKFLFNNEVTSISLGKDNHTLNSNVQINDNANQNKLAFAKEIKHVCIPRLFNNNETNSEATSTMKQLETAITPQASDVPNINLYSRDPRRCSRTYIGNKVRNEGNRI